MWGCLKKAKAKLAAKQGMTRAIMQAVIKAAKADIIALKMEDDMVNMIRQPSTETTYSWLESSR